MKSFQQAPGILKYLSLFKSHNFFPVELSNLNVRIKLPSNYLLFCTVRLKYLRAAWHQQRNINKDMPQYEAVVKAENKHEK